MFFDKQEDIKMKENAETDPPHLLEVFRRVLVNGSEDESNVTQQPRSYDFIFDYFRNYWMQNHVPQK